MDEQVLRAMKRWPSVPAVHGWLRLGQRGIWYLIDRGAPGFDPVRDGGGSPITSPPILAFIARNYEADGDGAWYFQNGPQRVFVDLDLAPLILRVAGTGDERMLVSHVGGAVARIDDACFDERGNLFVATDLGPGVIDDRDLVRLVAAEADSDRIELPRYRLSLEWTEDQATPLDAIAARLGFQRSPTAPAAGPAPETSPGPSPGSPPGPSPGPVSDASSAHPATPPGPPVSGAGP